MTSPRNFRRPPPTVTFFESRDPPRRRPPGGGHGLFDLSLVWSFALDYNIDFSLCSAMLIPGVKFRVPSHVYTNRFASTIMFSTGTHLASLTFVLLITFLVLAADM